MSETVAQEAALLEAGAIVACFSLAVIVGAIAGRHRWVAVPDGSKRIGCFDGLRGYLALGVMIHHFVVWMGVLNGLPWQAPANHIFQNFGQGSVALFFMITGALFYTKIVAKDWSKVNWRALYISRVFRLAPLFWFAFLVVNAVVFTRNGFTYPTTLREYAWSAIRWLLFISLPPLAGDADAARIVAYAPWTLTYEWICYLALPLIAAALGLANRGIPRLVILAALFTACAFRGSTQGTLPMALLLATPFLLGMMAMELTRHPRLRRLLVSPWAAAAGLVALSVELTVFPTSFALGPYIALALFFLPVVAGNAYFGVLAMRSSIVLGEASYGIYLMHGIVLYVALTDARPLMEAYGPTPFWIALPLLVVVVVSISIVLHELIEKPAICAGKVVADSWSRPLKRSPAGN